MAVIDDPDYIENDPLHPFHKTAILFAPRRQTSSHQNSSQRDSNQSDTAQSEERPDIAMEALKELGRGKKP